jgi:SAM-dependent methyltransferase
MTINDKIDVSKFQGVLQCPSCGSPIRTTNFTCIQCGRVYIQNEQGQLNFLETDEGDAVYASAQTAENYLKNYFKQWPRFYRFIIFLVAPVLYSGLTVRKFFSRFPKGSLMLNVGSGPTREHPNVINLDLFPFPEVDIIALGNKMPFCDDAFDAVCSEQVLEHVHKPQEVIAEMIRVTKPGGLIYISVPFIYPYHPSPDDFSRWSIEGVTAMLWTCKVQESGVKMGPTSALLVVLAMWLATVTSFGNQSLRIIFNHLFMLILSPLKFLDLIIERIPGAKDTAASIYVVAKK